MFMNKKCTLINYIQKILHRNVSENVLRLSDEEKRRLKQRILSEIEKRAY